ncbi:hypothetical protein MMYC01_203954 [Madurella mycetomatis]|uniref:Uncharacterized protein n=1 Tax=Madurella mycetomatis TaxID=100816 RepID=A0A175W6G5_9PEZI|nr:hypothetical protein MMYC01_203954 [Madurella mycetomatis]
MLCGIYHHSHAQQQNRFLRGLRSHKSWKHHDSHIETMHHYRKPSDTGSSSSLDSHPSTSSKADLSVDWDPLRLHPPTARGSAPQLPDAALGDGASTASSKRPYQPRGLRQARSSHNLGRNQPMQHRCASSDTVIYGGFDFGFDAKPTPASSSRRRRDPSPTPSDASTVSSSSSSIPSGSEDSPLEGLAPAPAHPHSHYQRLPHGRPVGLEDGAEHFLRRGGWKRRGIVFVDSSALLAGEDETWEI